MRHRVSGTDAPHPKSAAAKTAAAKGRKGRKENDELAGTRHSTPDARSHKLMRCRRSNHRGRRARPNTKWTDKSWPKKKTAAACVPGREPERAGGTRTVRTLRKRARRARSGSRKCARASPGEGARPTNRTHAPRQTRKAVPLRAVYDRTRPSRDRGHKLPACELSAHVSRDTRSAPHARRGAPRFQWYFSCPPSFCWSLPLSC